MELRADLDFTYVNKSIKIDVAGFVFFLCCSKLHLFSLIKVYAGCFVGGGPLKFQFPLTGSEVTGSTYMIVFWCSIPIPM